MFRTAGSPREGDRDQGVEKGVRVLDLSTEDSVVVWGIDWKSGSDLVISINSSMRILDPATKHIHRSEEANPGDAGLADG